jgi:hypothetical protein
MKIFVAVVFLAITGSFVNCDTLSDNVDACMIKFVMDKGLLSKDFPYAGTPRTCSLVQPVISAMEDKYYSSFDGKESIKADCVKQELKNNSFIYLLLKKEMVEKSKLLSREEINRMLDENKKNMKKVLNDAAEACHSNPTWEGIFDEYLDITNKSKSVAEKNYCSLKASIDHKFVDIGDININPQNIDTSKVDCNKIIEDSKADFYEQLRDENTQMGYENDKVDCIINSFKNSQFFEISLALNALESNPIDSAVRAQNKDKLNKKLRSAMFRTFSCFVEKESK